VEFQVVKPGIPESNTMLAPESGGIPGGGIRNSRIHCSSGVHQWNSMSVEPGIPESSGMAGQEFWSPVKFQVSETQHS